MMAENTKFLFAISFLLLSIFATYCPIPRLFSHVKAAERREALCREHGEGYYYDSGQGRCISCDIPCKSSNESCREHGCFDYYFNVKSKKELCKPDEFYEKSIERCRPCSIPCSVNDKLCQDMGCKISSPLPTPNLPPTTTPPDNSGPPILTKTTSAPDSSDSTGSTMWMASVIPIIALLIIIVVTVICCRKKQIGNWFVQKYRHLGAENNYNQCQKIFLNYIIKKCCHAKYEEIIRARNIVNAPSITSSGPGDITVNPTDNREEVDQSNNRQRAYFFPRQESLSPSLMEDLPGIPFADEDYPANNGGQSEDLSQRDASTPLLDGPATQPPEGQTSRNGDTQKHYTDASGRGKYQKLSQGDSSAIGEPAGADQLDAIYDGNQPTVETDRDKSIGIETPDDRMNPSIESKQGELNAELGIKLQQCISERDFLNLRAYFKGPHGISDVRAIEDAHSVPELIDLLIRKKKIKVGEPDGYRMLIQALKLIGDEVSAEMVEKYQTSIANAGNPRRQSTR